MKIISSLLLALLPAFSSAAISMEIMVEHPDYPGQCVVDGTPHPLNDEWDDSSAQTSTCQKKFCWTDAKYLLVETHTCPFVSADSRCYKVEDNTASYPDCCPRYVCPAIDEASNRILDDENKVADDDDVIDALMNDNDVITNEIQDSSDDDVIDNIMMESRIAEPVRVMLPPPEATVDYDVAMGDDVTGDYSDTFLQSPFRRSIQSGKPIVQFRR